MVVDERVDKKEKKVELKINVTNVEKCGQQLSADVTVTEYGEVRNYHVNTNAHGEGFWIDGEQKAGNGQFAAYSKDSFRAKVRSWFTV